MRSQDAPIPLDPVSGYAGGARRADHVAGTADRRLEMVRIIDMECSIPRAASETEPTPAEPARGRRRRAEQPAGYGMANYGRIFRSRREGADRSRTSAWTSTSRSSRGLGIVRSVPFGVFERGVGGAPAQISRSVPRPRAHQHQRVQRHDRRARAGAARPRGGLRALGVSALVDCIPASDRRYYPLYAKAAELGIPVRIYSSMNYANDRPLRPRPPAPSRPGRDGLPRAHASSAASAAGPG